MTTTLEQYREAKNHFQKLKTQAKKDLIARFNELASEMLRIQRELLDDFGEKIAVPTVPKKPKAAKTAEPKPEPPTPPKPKSSEAIALEKQIARQKKKLAETQAASKPTKAIEDRIYELEDELRLLELK